MVTDGFAHLPYVTNGRDAGAVLQLFERDERRTDVQAEKWLLDYATDLLYPDDRRSSVSAACEIINYVISQNNWYVTGIGHARIAYYNAVRGLDDQPIPYGEPWDSIPK